MSGKINVQEVSIYDAENVVDGEEFGGADYSVLCADAQTKQLVLAAHAANNLEPGEVAESPATNIKRYFDNQDGASKTWSRADGSSFTPAATFEVANTPLVTLERAQKLYAKAIKGKVKTPKEKKTVGARD